MVTMREESLAGAVDPAERSIAGPPMRNPAGLASEGSGLRELRKG